MTSILMTLMQEQEPTILKTMTASLHLENPGIVFQDRDRRLGTSLVTPLGIDNRVTLSINVMQVIPHRPQQENHSLSLICES